MSELYWPCFHAHSNQYMRPHGYILPAADIDGVPSDALPGAFPQSKLSAQLMVTLYLLDERSKNEVTGGHFR